MINLFEALFTGPTLPGTIVLGICAAYWLLLILGAVDLDLLDVEVDVDPGSDQGSTSWGMAALRFLNINDVPLMIWLSIFAGGYVVSSVWLDGTTRYGGDVGAFAASVTRSGVIALVATKVLTQPLRGKFGVVEPNVATTLVGRTCVITTNGVSPSFGQARVESNGAPLLLNVRGAVGMLVKNQAAVITGYDPDQRVFFVEPLPAVPLEPPHTEAV
jgi:hypothetical protein